MLQQFGRVDGPGEKGTGLGLSIVKALMEKCMSCGANDFLIKPFESADLVAKIKALLAKK